MEEYRLGKLSTAQMEKVNGGYKINEALAACLITYYW
jgi:hypothetical protein